MDSNFFFPVTVHQNGVTVTNVAQWVAKLPLNPPMGTAVAVLYSTEGAQLQGMYLYDTQQFRWRYLIPYSNVCQAIIEGSALDLYYQVQTPVTLPANTVSWRNGVLYSGTQIDTTPTVAWAVLTMLATGTVDSVNGVNPGAGGNVSIGISDIPGLQTALNSAGSIKSVNSQSPNAGGNVTLLAEDNNAATGVSLITDNGAADGTFKFKTLVAGSNVTVVPDTNGNLVIAATGGASGVTSVALALPSIFSVTGSPVTSTGTLTGTLVAQAANAVFRGPVSGAPGIPTFGPLVSADLPLATTSTAGAVIVGSGLTVTAGTVSAAVLSVSGRTGAITLTVSDVSGAAPLASPTFTGVPAAPTATAGTNTTQIATTAFVQAAVSAGSVLSFNTRTGAVTLSAADVTGVGGALLASPTFTGVPAAPTAAAGTNTTQIATTAFVATSYAPLASPALTGTPTAPTATAGTNTTQLATTAFVTAAVSGVSGVASFNTRTGAVTLTAADVTGVGGALLASPTFTGIPAAPTATAGTNTTQLATTAFVTAAVSAGSVTSFNTRTGAVTLSAADVTGVGGALLASPTFTGTPAAPTATAGTSTTQIATTAFVATSYAPLASPVFTGRSTVPADEYTATALGSVSGTITLNLTLASEWSFTPSAATTVAFSNPPASGLNQVIYLQITNGGAFTITWPTGTQFASGTAPTLTPSGTDVLGVKYNATAAVYQLYVIGLNVH